MILIWILSLSTFFIFIRAEYCQRRIKNSNNSLSIQDCHTFHQIYINVGTPFIQYPFLIDTGSLMTWVPTVDCNCGLGINSNIKNQQNITPNSYNQRIQIFIQYADGDSIFGYQGTQLFSIPNTTLRGIQFSMIFVTQKQAPKIGDRGVLALGYDANNIFDTAYQKGYLSTSAFTIDFGNSVGKSKIYFDKIPQKVISGSIYAPILTNLHLWAVQCKGLVINNINFSRFIKSTLLIDSGTTITTLNKQLYNQLLRSIFSSCKKINYPEQIGLLCPSSLRVPEIQFYIQGGIVHLNPQYYSFLQGNQIHVQLVSSNVNILGSSFFKNYAITFDKLNKRIGFYNSNYNRNLIMYP